eukprot:1159471-Pelagomonas_calceolata.AAC.4
MTRHDQARPGMTRHDQARPGMTRHDQARPGRAPCFRSALSAAGAEGPEKLQEVGAVALRSGSLAAVMRSIQLQVRLQGKGAVSKNAVGAVVLRSGSIAALYAAHVSRHCANLVTRWVARKGAISQSAKVALIKNRCCAWIGHRVLGSSSKPVNLKIRIAVALGLVTEFWAAYHKLLDKDSLAVLATLF